MRCLNRLAFGMPLAALATLSLTSADSQVAAQSKPAAVGQQPCVILKRMGPADQVTSHLYSFGIRGKQFQFVEGQVPEGIKFHGRLTDHDVRKIQDSGGKVSVIDSHYTPQDLEQARKSCSNSVQTSKSDATNSAEVKPDPSKIGSKPTSETAESQPRAAAVAQTTQLAAPAAEPSTIVCKSTPDGADITVDGKFVGSTPSTLKLVPGEHKITVEKSGYKAWQRTITVSSGGTLTMDATLEKGI